MKEIVALESLIKEEEERVAFAKRQLSDHESGASKMTAMIKASTETKLEKTEIQLAKNKELLAEILSHNLADLQEQERLREAVQRKNYYHYQKIRVKREKTHTSDTKVEATMIIDELPEQVDFEDKELFAIAQEVMRLSLRTHIALDKELLTIRKSFDDLTSKIEDKNIKDFGLLKYRIPIVVLYFSVLRASIHETMEDADGSEFVGFPKFQDWWIAELWTSHQAYFALYKWKSIISNLCVTSEQKLAWESIFSTWIFIKNIISRKGVLAFEYNFAFDSLVSEFSQLEEELSEANLISMEKIIKAITKNENFTTYPKSHNRITPFLEYKRKQLKFEEPPK